MQLINADSGPWMDDIEECAKELRRRNCSTPPAATVQQTITALRSTGYDVFPFAERVIACFLGMSLRSEFDPDSGTFNPRIYDFEPSGMCDESERENVADWEHAGRFAFVRHGTWIACRSSVECNWTRYTNPVKSSNSLQR
jgi:hypothetical protein